MNIHFSAPAKRPLLVLIFLLSGIFSCFSQVILTMESNTEPTADLVSIDIKAAGWQNIVSAQWSIHFDPAAMTYQNAGNFQLANMNNASIGTYYAGEGTLIIIWYAANLTGQSIPDGSSLFKLYFKPLLTGNTNVEINSIPRQVDIRKFDGTVQEATMNPLELNLELPAETKNAFLEPSKVHCFPNPVSDYVTFELSNSSSSASEHQLQIFDNQGNLIIEKRFSTENTILSLEAISQGMYFYKIFDRQKIPGFGSFTLLR